VRQEHIVLTAGATDAIENLFHAICDDGDSVLVPGPHWRKHLITIPINHFEYNGRKNNTNQPTAGLETILKRKANVNIITVRPPTYSHWDNYLLPSLQAAYDFSDQRNRIKAVIICNPNNPLSRCYPRETILGLMEFCQERNLHLISNEIYALTSLDSTSASPSTPPFVSALSLTEPLVPEGAVKVDPSRIHVVWSASALLGLSGLRIVSKAGFAFS
jgi:aspartate/methionine/tyrosine aminotransferase